MMEFELQRDHAFRGYWVKGLKEIDEYCRKHTYVDGDEFFIPDKLIDLLWKALYKKK